MLKVLTKTVISIWKTLKSRISTKLYSKSLKIDGGAIGEIFLKLKLAFGPNRKIEYLIIKYFSSILKISYVHLYFTKFFT